MCKADNHGECHIVDILTDHNPLCPALFLEPTDDEIFAGLCFLERYQWPMANLPEAILTLRILELEGICPGDEREPTRKPYATGTTPARVTFTLL